MTEISQARTKNYLKQLKGSGIYKLGAVLATFIAMPIMIKYLGVEMFGVWSTMLTLISWVMLFDLGIGNGLKNKITESLAQDNAELASGFISTAYVLVGGVSLVLFLIFLVASFWLPWQAIFNTQSIDELALRESVITLSFFVFFNFWISLVNQIYHGLQQSSVVVLGQFISNVMALIFVYALYQLTEASIVYMVWAYGVSLVVANMLLSFLMFRQRTEFKPSIRLFAKEKIKALLSLGIKFFVIQFAVLMIFMTDKILITQLLGPAEVTPYEVLFKLFSVFTVLHSLILVPLWPAYSDAYSRNDIEWIKKQIIKQLKIGGLICIGAIVLAVLGQKLVRIWIGFDFSVGISLYLLFAVFIVMSVWNNIFGYVLGGIGKVRLGAYHTFLSALINVPLSYVLVVNFEMGLNGILVGTIFACTLSFFISPIQCYYFFFYERKNSLLTKVLS